MSNFIETDNGWVNLDHVESFERVEAAKGRPTYIFRRRGGTPIDRVTGIDFDPEDIEGVIIPAASDARAVVIDVDTSTARPTEEDVWTDHHSIVAWRVGRDGVTPILPTDTGGGSEALTLIEQPNGHLVSQWDDSYDTLDAAKAYALLSAQDAWDREHPVAESAA